MIPIPLRSRSLGLTLVLALCACHRDTGVHEKPMNVLVVVLDTLRPDRLSCYDAPRPTSPRLDRIAHDSVVFDDAISAAPLTVASLLTLMTSLYPEVHQVQGAPNPGRMSENVTTLAEILARRGYATAAFTEGGYANPDFGLGQGFALFPRHADDRDPNVTNLLGESRLAANVDRTVEWLRRQRTDPFFLFFHTYEIHAPYRAREEYVRMFRPGFDEPSDHARTARAIERWNRERTTSPEDALAMLQHLYQCPLGNLPELQDPDAFAQAAHALRLGPQDAVECAELLALVRDLYDASIRYTDHELERLWDALDDLRLADDTLVVLVSDHGEGLGQHREMEHSNVLFEEALRVLLAIHVPGKSLAPRRIASTVRTVDVMPTVLDLLGVDPAAYLLEGRSLVPLMRGELEPDRVAFSHARRIGPDQNPQYSVRSGSFRLIEEPAVARRWLYDLAADPGELVDIAEKHPEVVARLRALLVRQAEQDRFLRERIRTTPETAQISEQTRRDLRALGYAGAADGR